jgi:type II secretory pathway pseudopilin PulG
MAEPKKQTIYGKISQWALGASLASLIVLIAGSILTVQTGSSACMIHRAFDASFGALIGLAALCFGAGFILAVVHRIIAKGFPRFFIGNIFLFVLLILVFLGLPEFLGNRERAKQDEAKKNLPQIFERQEQYKAKNGKYAQTFKELGWKPTGEIKYKYFLSPQESMKGGCPSCDYALPAGIKPNVADDSFTIVAVSNIDCDPTLDVWSINNQKLLVNDVDDVKN